MARWYARVLYIVLLITVRFRLAQGIVNESTVLSTYKTTTVMIETASTSHYHPEPTRFDIVNTQSLHANITAFGKPLDPALSKRNTPVSHSVCENRAGYSPRILAKDMELMIDQVCMKTYHFSPKKSLWVSRKVLINHRFGEFTGWLGIQWPTNKPDCDENSEKAHQGIFATDVSTVRRPLDNILKQADSRL